MTSLTDFALADIPARWDAPRVCEREQCGRTYIPKYRPRPGMQQRFCSKSCKTAWQNHAHPPRGGTPRPPGWERNRLLAKSRARRLRHAETWDGIPDEEIYERDGWRCQIPGCKRRPIRKDLKYPHPRSASIDHIVPISLGGDDTAENKRAAHLDCNRARGNQMREEQVALFGSLREPPLATLTVGERAVMFKPRGLRLCWCGARVAKGQKRCGRCQQERDADAEERRQAAARERAQEAQERQLRAQQRAALYAEIRKLRAQGLTTRATAARLGTSQRTVTRVDLADPVTGKIPR